MSRKDIEKLLDILPNNMDISKAILKNVKNDHTKVKEKEDFKGNYYSFVGDVIFISKNINDKSNLNRGIVIAHECRHSVQNKFLQILNTIFSNAYLIFIIISLISILKGSFNLYFVLSICICNIMIKEILELDATYSSKGIFIEYLNKDLKVANVDDLNKQITNKIYLAIFLYFFKIIFEKLVPILILILINYIKCHIF